MAYDKLYEGLDTKENTLYRLARQMHQAGQNGQQAGMIKDKDEESILRIWKECYKGLMNEEHEGEREVNDGESVNLEVWRISKEELRENMKSMKNGNAVGPGNIPVEVWKCLGESGPEFVTKLYNRTMESEMLSEEWRDSVLMPIVKNKVDVQSCTNYLGIKLINHTMKLWERVVE